tara:strand:+ start:669 stop:1457 length:789 start_codon:yes stop_codon:yes gene_type:complete
MGGPGSGNPGQSRGPGGKFITLALEVEGTKKAASEIDKVAEKTTKLKKSTEKSSEAVKKNTDETNKNTVSKKKNADQDKALIDGQTKKIIMLQASTSALNQATGATYKMIAGFEAWGALTTEQAAKWQKLARRAELFTGALELGLSAVTIHTTMTELNTAARTKNAAATGAQAAAQNGLNAALLRSPWVMAAVAIGVVGYQLYKIERDTGKLTSGFAFMNKEIREFIGYFAKIGDIADNNPLKRIGSSLSPKNLNLEVLGVG